ncbi:MAG: sensor histidine kinase [Gammaproteobacteria bacterium]
MSALSLQTAMVFSAFLSGLVAAFYYALSIKRRSASALQCYRLLAVAYAAYALRLVCQLAAPATGFSPDLASDLLYVGWATALWLGIRAYDPAAKLHRALCACPAFLVLWVLAAHAAGLPFFWHALPLHAAGAVMFILAGLDLWRYRRQGGNGTVSFLAVLMWLHAASTASYPFTRLSWYAPYGFMLFAMLSAAIGMGLMVAALLEEERRLRREINAHLETEKALGRSLTFLETLLSRSPAGITAYEGETGNCVLANHSIAAMVGGPVHELRNHNFRSIASWRESGLVALAESTLADGVTRQCEVVLHTQYDKTVPLECFLSRFEVEGRPHLLFTAADISERKRIEQALMLRERQYRTLVENIPQLLVRYDTALRRVYVNPAWEKASGIAANDVVSRHPTDTPGLANPVNAEYMQRLRKVLKTGLPEVIEFPWVNAYGTTLYLDYAIVPEFDRDGTITGLLCSGYDLTERKRIEDDLRRHREHLEELVAARTEALAAANHELEAFSYSVSHDLRAPLRAIDGFSQMLSKRYSAQLDDEAQRLISVVRNNTARMAQLIDDLLAFSRIGRTDMLRSQVDMDALVHAVWADIEPQRARREIRLDVKPLPQALGDLAMLRQVWMNLLSNAVKFTQPRAVAHIEVGWFADGEQAGYYVKDDGVGFETAYKHKLFTVFQRLHGVEEFEGTGIGLAIVKRIVSRHGGRVTAEGKVNAGATFSFTLPAAAAKTKEPARIVRDLPTQ